MCSCFCEMASGCEFPYAHPWDLSRFLPTRFQNKKQDGLRGLLEKVPLQSITTDTHMLAPPKYLASNTFPSPISSSLSSRQQRTCRMMRDRAACLAFVHQVNSKCDNSRKPVSNDMKNIYTICPYIIYHHDEHFGLFHTLRSIYSRLHNVGQ